MAQAAELSNDWTVLDRKLKTFNRLMTTKAAIGQTPKELIWTLNKAKLYRYIPVVPAEERYPIPLILIFALMNRPTILDLARATVLSNTWSAKAMTFICSIGEFPDRRIRN